MFDIKELKEKIQNGGIALSHSLEERVMTNTMTDEDHKFLSRTINIMRDLSKK